MVVGPPVVQDRPSLHIRLVPQVQESGRRRVCEYHEDSFQLLPALSALCYSYGLSCGPGYWKFFSVPVLLAKTESLKLWILTR